MLGSLKTPGVLPFSRPGLEPGSDLAQGGPSGKTDRATPDALRPTDRDGSLRMELLRIRQHLQMLNEGVARLEAGLGPVYDEHQSNGSVDAEDLLEAGVVSIDHRARKVRVNGSEIELSPGEYRCLHELVRNAGRVVVRRDLLRITTRDSTDDESQIKAYVARLRAKLAAANAPREVIENVRGVGYRLAETNDPA